MRVPGKVPTARRNGYLSRQPGRNQLVFALLQSPHRIVLHSRVGQHYSVYVKEQGGIRRKESSTAAAADDRPFRNRPPNRPTVESEAEGYGAVRAIDPKTGERKWEYKMSDVTDGGILTTASDLLFSGGREGYFFALDARRRETAVEGARRRSGHVGANDLLGEWQTVRRRRRGKLAVRFRAEEPAQ